MLFILRGPLGHATVSVGPFPFRSLLLQTYASVLSCRRLCANTLRLQIAIDDYASFLRYGFSFCTFISSVFVIILPLTFYIDCVLQVEFSTRFESATAKLSLLLLNFCIDIKYSKKLKQKVLVYEME